MNFRRRTSILHTSFTLLRVGLNFFFQKNFPTKFIILSISITIIISFTVVYFSSFISYVERQGTWGTTSGFACQEDC